MVPALPMKPLARRRSNVTYDGGHTAVPSIGDGLRPTPDLQTAVRSRCSDCRGRSEWPRSSVRQSPPGLPNVAHAIERESTMRRSALLIALIASVASACSNSTTTEPGAAGTTTTANVVGTAQAAPSDGGAPASTSTLPASSTAAQQPTDEQLVLAVHTRFIAMFGGFGSPPNPDHPEILATTTGAARERLRATLASMLTQGRHSTGGYRSEVRSVRVEGDNAWVEDCSLDEGVEYGPDGALLTAADTAWYLRTAQLVRLADGWMVEDFYKGVECSPA